MEIKGKPKQLETLTSKDIYKTLMQYDNIKSRSEQIYEHNQRRVKPDQCYFTVQITGINSECSL